MVCENLLGPRFQRIDPCLSEDLALDQPDLLPKMAQYGKEVDLGDKKYIDGFYAVTIETLINKAIKEGATKIIAINCNPVRSDLEEIIETYTFKKKFGLEGKNFYEKKGDHNGAKVIDIYPTRELPTSLWEVDKDDMIETFFIGYQNMSTNKNVAECINHKKRWLI